METFWTIIAVLAVCFIPVVALPIVKLIDIQEEQLLTMRGASAAIIATIVVMINPPASGPDVYTFVIAISFAIAAIGLYKAIRSEWGANRSIVMVTATPILNVLAALLLFNRSVAFSVLIGIGLLILGVVIALQPWKGEEEAGEGNSELSFGWGLACSVVSVVSNAVMYESFQRTTAPFLINIFWIGVVLTIASMVLAKIFDKQTLFGFVEDIEWTDFWPIALVFALHGFPYLFANQYVFQHMPVEPASAIVQAEIPLVVATNAHVCKIQITKMQWAGLLLALAASFYVTVWLLS